MLKLKSICLFNEPNELNSFIASWTFWIYFVWRELIIAETLAVKFWQTFWHVVCVIRTLSNFEYLINKPEMIKIYTELTILERFQSSEGRWIIRMSIEPCKCDNNILVRHVFTSESFLGFIEYFSNTTIILSESHILSIIYLIHFLQNINHRYNFSVRATNL